MRPGRKIAGEVVEATGAPLSGAKVLATSKIHGPAGFCHAIQQGSGHFELGGLVEGEYELHAESEGARSKPVVAVSGQRDARIAFPTSASMGGEHSFRCERIAPGRYDVTAWAGAEWVAMAQDVVVVAGDRTALDLTFRRGAPIACTLSIGAQPVRLELAWGNRLLRSALLEAGRTWRSAVPAGEFMLRCRAGDGALLTEHRLTAVPGERLDQVLP